MAFYKQNPCESLGGAWLVTYKLLVKTKDDIEWDKRGHGGRLSVKSEPLTQRDKIFGDENKIGL